MTMPDGTSPPPPPQPGYPPPSPQPAYSPPGPSQPYVSAGPTGYSQPPITPPKRRRSGLAALAVLVVLVILIVGGLALFRDRISGDVGGLQAGDCIDEPSDTSSITDVQHQPCSEPHDGEVFVLLTYPGANGAIYPGTSAFTDYVRQQCLPAVASYTGRTLDEIDAAGLSYAYLYPTESSWTGSSNDRGVTCYIDRADGQKMLGSVKATTPAPSASN